ncbi:MAG TPA: FHA domain-containing protein, partial [Polyangiaceae bacterium]|nr:FHA domain-containing protein [Polyangiaceae bacterium]
MNEGGPTTAAMQAYGEQASPDGPLGTRAGLVLLYAPSYNLFDPAYVLDEADLIIGRAPESGICILEAAVSRQHARIHFKGGRWFLTDLGGRNGTLVDGEFVREITLEHLHEIRVGDAIFKFVEADVEGYARFRIDGSIVGASPEAVAVHKARLGDIVGGHQVVRIASSLERV